MKLQVQKFGEKETGSITVVDEIFSVEFNEPLIHQVLTAYLAGSRTGSKSQKTRSEVRGGGKKPWRQKGTGRARAGTIRSPLWRGGGVTFASKPKDHSKKVNKKMYRGAMRSIFSELLRQDRLVCIDDISIEEPKTKLVKQKLEGVGLNGELLIVTHELSEELFLGVKNLPKVDVIDVNELNPYLLVGFEKILITKDSVQKVEGWLS